MKETLKKLREALEPMYGKGESDAIIRLIFHYVKGWNLTDMLIHREDELSPFVKGEIEKILKRLEAWEPIQYITGEARFYGMELDVKPGVLIPRQETEELVDLIIDENKGKDDLRVLDLCTGSGCIAIALARNLPFSKVTALDISETAVEIAKENAKKLRTRVEIREGDIMGEDWLRGEEMWDIIVSNPPYVMDREALTMERNVLDYEPHEALFVRDEDPLVFYRRIGEIAIKRLRKGGRLYFEINPLKALELKEMIERMGFEDVRLIRDSFGNERFLSCVKN
ncbi:MAG: peptide chain release factor N(5)-glutamine methyltransferase [Muribaculaceae bacterium]|nr:peptide chain release factor N(5)-glutamine methyltransferase [Muribaculaceae bacterium]